MPSLKLSALHPRQAMYSRYWERRTAAMDRMGPGVLQATRTRSDQPGWVDYYPDFPGTIVEKMIFQELVDRGITFYFGAYWGDMPFTAAYERYRPDFILPEYKIVLEVYGAYWHSREGMYKKDAWKEALYTASGYKHYILWDYEIYTNPAEVLNKVPELLNPIYTTKHVFVAERPFDPTASLVAQRQKGPKVVRTHLPRRPQKYTPLAVHKPYLKLPKEPPSDADWGPRFTGLPDESAEYFSDYGADWRRYMNQLDAFFKEDPNRGRQYPSHWRYWAKWYNWMTRWDRLTEEDWVDYYNQLETYFNAYPDAWKKYRSQYYEWQSWRKAGVVKIW